MSTSQTDQPEHRSIGQVVKDILLFLAAPFITLGCLMTFPFIAALMLTRRGEHLRRRLWTD